MDSVSSATSLGNQLHDLQDRHARLENDHLTSVHQLGAFEHSFANKDATLARMQAELETARQDMSALQHELQEKSSQ